MKVEGTQYRTVWMDGSSVRLIEQNLLPFKFQIYKSETCADTCKAIKDMIVRGAGAIGATAGFAMEQAFLESKSFETKDMQKYTQNAMKAIKSTRPTAQNLFYAVDRVFNAAIMSAKDVPKWYSACEEAQKIADEDANACRKIGEYGNTLIENGFNIGTHCNAGWLAFVDWGSALSPIYVAHRQGKKVTVYADETRPRGQGARLTAWELQNEGVPHFIVPDNAAAYLMSKGMLDMFIVGADRIARNGDVANKIGTLEKAIVAARYHVPFYVAAPTSTFDLKCEKGEYIPIEQRSQEEVLFQTGRNSEGKIEEILVCSPDSPALNPAFDVTLAGLITGIITEKGIIKPTEEEILGLFK